MERLLKFVVVTLCLSPTILNAQKNNGTYTLEEAPKKENTSSASFAKDGTYQIRVSKAEHTPLISKELLGRIESLRKENEEVTVRLDEYSELYIPSASTVRSATFVPLQPVQYPSK